MPGRHVGLIITSPKRTSKLVVQHTKPHACHAKAVAERQRPRSAKAYIKALVVHQVPRLPTKAAAERWRPTSAKAYIRVLAVHQAPRLPRKSSGREVETKERQSVHQSSCNAPSPTPATSGREVERCTKPHACHAKAATERRRPRSAKAYVRALAMHQAPRLPRKSSGREVETKERLMSSGAMSM